MLLSKPKALLCLAECHQPADLIAYQIKNRFVQRSKTNIKTRIQVLRQNSTHAGTTCQALDPWLKLTSHAQPNPLSPTTLQLKRVLGCSSNKFIMCRHGRLHASPPCRPSWRCMQVAWLLHNQISLQQQPLSHPHLTSSSFSKHTPQAY